VVVLNSGDQPQDFQLWLAGQGAKTTAAPHSIMTLVLN
jgi:glucosylceramidase